MCDSDGNCEMCRGACACPGKTVKEECKCEMVCKCNECKEEDSLEGQSEE